MSGSLVDEGERRRIREDLAAALFVEAGAGTGKTRELVERLLALVRARVPLRSIAAITFTEAAAAELRDRVRFALEAMHLSADGQAREIARSALEQLDGAALETLHSFSGRLLGLYPVEAGLPPRFQVLDDVAFAIAADEEWERASVEILADPSLEAPLTYALALNVRISGARFGAADLRGVFDNFGENWDRLPVQPEPLSEFREPDLGALVDALDDAEAFRPQCRDDADRLLPLLDDLAAFRRRLAHATTTVQRARMLPAYIADWGRRLGRAPNWPDVEAVRSAVQQARLLRDELLADLGTAALSPLVEALRQATLEFAERRRREGTLSFHDLLVLARNLLRDNHTVRAELHQRFGRILIDEFQDTDPLQAEIAGLLARDPSGAIQPGRVFFVGDAKQSIYRFRRADIAMFRASREQFGCEPAVLGSNFRSTSAVLEWCNHVFAQLLKDEPGQAPYEPLTPARKDPSGGTVHLLGQPLPPMPAGAAREVEAEQIAAALRTMHGRQWRVYDKRDEAWRPARFDDIAVLIRSRAILPYLQRALEDLDIPYRVESRSLVYNTQEIRDLTNILAAIDDPTDEVAVVAALRSPGFGCGDDDLLRHRSSGGRWDYMAQPSVEPGDTPSPVAHGFEFLRRLHERRFWAALGELVETVIRERALREIAWSYRRPREHWQRYRFLLEQVRALEANQGANLHALVLWLRRQAEGAALVNESVVPEEDDDAVRVMTVHAAKGLEFPIVLVAGFGGTNAPRAFVVWGGHDSMPQVKLGNAATAGFEIAFEREKTLDAYERDRLLYVAATRARDHLVVSVFHMEPKSMEAPSDAQRLWEASAGAPGLWRTFEPESVQAALPAGRPDNESRQQPGDVEAWRTSRDTLLRQQVRLASVAATSLGEIPAPEPEPPADEHADAVLRRGRAGTAVGRAVHAVLQSVDLETGANVDRLARAEAAAESVPARAAEVAGLVRAALNSGPVREAIASGRYWREVFVSAPSNGVLIEGFIDLLYETRDGLVVVDYKTDGVASDDDIVATLARYRLQGAAYVFALEQNLRRPVVACRFLFLRPAGTRTVEIAGLRGAVADVEARVEAIATASL